MKLAFLNKDTEKLTEKDFSKWFSNEFILNDKRRVFKMPLTERQQRVYDIAIMMLTRKKAWLEHIPFYRDKNDGFIEIVIYAIISYHIVSERTAKGYINDADMMLFKFIKDQKA